MVETSDRAFEKLRLMQAGKIICGTCGKQCADQIPPSYRTKNECICDALAIVLTQAVSSFNFKPLPGGLDG